MHASPPAPSHLAIIGLKGELHPHALQLDAVALLPPVASCLQLLLLTERLQPREIHRVWGAATQCCALLSPLLTVQQFSAALRYGVVRCVSTPC